MGLTIHCSLRSAGDQARPRTLIHALHQTAQDLPFKELGCLERVSDEGEFWEKRDLPALVAEIGSWNEMIAAFGGKLKDLLGDGPLGVQSAIAGYPNFEQLEAAGQDKLQPGYAQLASLIGRVGQRLRPQSTINNPPSTIK